MEKLNVLLLGVGNILLSDEGLGIKILEELENRYDLPEEVELMDGGTAGLEILPYIESRSHLFLLDAVRSEEKPGTIVIKDLDDPPAFFRQKISPHQIGLTELFAVASMQEVLPPSIKLFGIVPKDLSTGLELSPEVAAAVKSISEQIVNNLVGLGLSIPERE